MVSTATRRPGSAISANAERRRRAVRGRPASRGQLAFDACPALAWAKRLSSWRSSPGPTRLLATTTPRDRRGRWKVAMSRRSCWRSEPPGSVAAGHSCRTCREGACARVGVVEDHAQQLRPAVRRLLLEIEGGRVRRLGLGRGRTSWRRVDVDEVPPVRTRGRPTCRRGWSHGSPGGLAVEWAGGLGGLVRRACGGHNGDGDEHGEHGAGDPARRVASRRFGGRGRRSPPVARRAHRPVVIGTPDTTLSEVSGAPPSGGPRRTGRDGARRWFKSDDAGRGASGEGSADADEQPTRPTSGDRGSTTTPSRPSPSPGSGRPGPLRPRPSHRPKRRR